MSAEAIDLMLVGDRPHPLFEHLDSVLAFTTDHSGELIDGNGAFRAFAGSPRSLRTGFFEAPAFDDIARLPPGIGGEASFKGLVTLCGVGGAYESFRAKIFKTARVLAVVAERDVSDLRNVTNAVVAMNDDLSEAHRVLGRSRRKLLTLAASLVESHAAQRRELARELHEGVCQNLAGLKLYLEVLGADPGSNVERCLLIAKSLLDQVRALSTSLDAVDIDGLPTDAPPAPD